MKLERIACSVLSLLIPTAAQETRGIILGHVTDPQQGVVAGATVTVTNTDTNTRVTLTTNQKW